MIEIERREPGAWRSKRREQGEMRMCLIKIQSYWISTKRWLAGSFCIGLVEKNLMYFVPNRILSEIVGQIFVAVITWYFQKLLNTYQLECGRRMSFSLVEELMDFFENVSGSLELFTTDVVMTTHRAVTNNVTENKPERWMIGEDGYIV